VAGLHARLGNRVRWGAHAGGGGGGGGGGVPTPPDGTGDMTIQDGAIWGGAPAGAL
jgi:hypothetical protein